MDKVVSAPRVVLHIGDRMNANIASSLTLIYRLLLNVYPPSYRAEFGNEMCNTFIEGVEEAGSQGRLGRFILRELRDAPKSLANAYWDGWTTKLQNGIQVLQDIASTSDLPPAPPDGRDSWRQALLELGLFVVAALLLIMVTYFDGLDTGWQREPDFLGRVITWLTLPFLLLGLARGLPRWAYPFGGLLLGYHLFVSYQASLWLFLLVMLLAFFALAVAETLTNPHPSLLPLPLRRIGQSLSVDWTRLSFGVFGAMPLVILLAFDDAHLDNRTPYLALSALMMVVCALLYCRSREWMNQVTALLAGLTCVICGAWLDKIHFAGGLMNWVTVPAAGIPELLWLLRLWLHWGFLILLPVLFILLGRVTRLKRAV
jgi:hypothetical protein